MENSKNKTVVIACDHAGFELKDTVIGAAQDMAWDVIDVGTYSNQSADFPDFAQLGAEKILKGEADRGIFLCGSGVGVCVAANKIPGIYACVCHDTYSAHQGVEHDAMNVLCFGSRIIGPELAKELVKAYLTAEFNNAPNQVRRFDKIKRIEAGDLYLADKLKNLESAGQTLYARFDKNTPVNHIAVQQQIDDDHVRGIIVTAKAVCNCIKANNAFSNQSVPMYMSQWCCNQVYKYSVAGEIRDIANRLKPVYNETGGVDGFALVEHSCPSFTEENELAESVRGFWKSVNRPNLMIGLPAIEPALNVAKQLICEGINIFFTAVTSEKSFRAAYDTVLNALETRVGEGKPIDTAASCIVIEPDKIDEACGIAFSDNSPGLRFAHRLVALAEKIATSERVTKLRTENGKTPRLLWLTDRETGIQYQNRLIARDTITAMTPCQITTFRETGELRVLAPDKNAVQTGATPESTYLPQPISQKLQEAKVELMIKAFEAMQNGINQQSASVEKALDPLVEPILANFKKIDEESVISRMFAKDPTVWTFDTQAYPEIRNRLGWLDIYKGIEKSGEDYKAIRAGLKKDGIKKVLLIGMGGSSLAPEVLSLTFPEADGLDLQIIDSTDPGQVLVAEDNNPLAETVYIVASKSGGTAEIRALMDYFYAKAKDALGDDAGKHFIAITDPGTLLERTATELKFRHIVLSDPSIGGRFSVLSPFGIVPAVLIGLDPAAIYEKVSDMAKICAPSSPIGANEGAALGVYMGTATLNKRDKITILTDSQFTSFGSWLEQLIAESSGKIGRGIVPIDIEPELPANAYAADRAFVYVNYSGEKEAFVEELIAAGQPVLTIKLNDKMDIFREFYRWEIAISVACALINVNAFDQPNVQDSKTRTIAKVNDYKKNGKLDELETVWSAEGVEAYFNFESPALSAAKTVKEFVAEFVKLAKSGEDYIAINAYIPRNDETQDTLQTFRKNILETTNCATTLGFGPRFQHSTGQLHKGGANNGVFIQIVADSPRDAEIPGEGMSFAIFERAQALGDFDALLAMERRAVRLNLGKAPLSILID